jgi:hypothetical protein
VFADFLFLSFFRLPFSFDPGATVCWRSVRNSAQSGSRLVASGTPAHHSASIEENVLGILIFDDDMRHSLRCNQRGTRVLSQLPTHTFVDFTLQIALLAF